MGRPGVAGPPIPRAAARSSGVCPLAGLAGNPVPDAGASGAASVGDGGRDEERYGGGEPASLRVGVAVPQRGGLLLAKRRYRCKPVGQRAAVLAQLVALGLDLEQAGLRPVLGI